MKVNNTKRRFSMDPMNMTGFNGKRHCGLVNEKGCGIVPTKDNKGFTLLSKNKKKLNKPAQMVTKRTFKNKPGVALHKLEKTMMGYREDLKECFDQGLLHLGVPEAQKADSRQEGLNKSSMVWSLFCSMVRSHCSAAWSGHCSAAWSGHCSAAWSGHIVLQHGPVTLFCSMVRLHCSAAWSGHIVLQLGPVTLFCSMVRSHCSAAWSGHIVRQHGPVILFCRLFYNKLWN